MGRQVKEDPRRRPDRNAAPKALDGRQLEVVKAATKDKTSLQEETFLKAETTEVRERPWTVKTGGLGDQVKPKIGKKL